MLNKITLLIVAVVALFSSASAFAPARVARSSMVINLH